MSETVQASQACARLDLRGLADMPCDMVGMITAAQGLDLRELGAWQRLRMHLWMYGQLPVGERALAKIAGVGPASFARMAPALALHFDRDADGRWGDRILALRRGDRAVVPALERDGPSEALSSARRAAGGKGGAITQERRREKLRLVEGGRQDDPSLALDGDAPAAAVEQSGAKQPDGLLRDQANGQANGGHQAVVLVDSGEATPSSSRSKLASSESDGIQKLASEQAARAGEGAAGPAEANGQANGAGKTPAVEANGAAPRQANGADAAPSPAVGPSEATIIDAVVRVCEGKVSKAEAHRRISIFRAAIAEGMDFFLDILPQLQGFARRNARVDNCANRHVIDDARSHAASRRAVDAMPAAGGRAGVFVEKGSPQWARWLAHHGKRSMPSEADPSDRRRVGWWFPTEWPPDVGPESSARVKGAAPS